MRAYEYVSMLMLYGIVIILTTERTVLQIWLDR